VDGFALPQSSGKECIKIIEIDVRVDNVSLRDKFEWDINDPQNSPEDFAVLLCNE